MQMGEAHLSLGMTWLGGQHKVQGAGFRAAGRCISISREQVRSQPTAAL